MHNKKRSVLSSNLDQSNGGKKLATNVYEFRYHGPFPDYNYIVRKDTLEAYWYVWYDSMSDNYTPEEISAI